MHILLTNEHGIDAPGLLPMAQMLQEFGKVTILAPEFDWAVCDYLDRLDERLDLWPVMLLNNDLVALVSNANPADCVAYGLMGILSQPVDLVVSGINLLPSPEHPLTYSGGVTAVTESLMLGVPGIVVSQHPQPVSEEYDSAIMLTRLTIQHLLAVGLPANAFLNITAPGRPFNQLQGVHEMTRDLRVYYELLPQANQLATQSDRHIACIEAASIYSQLATAVASPDSAFITSLRLNPMVYQAMSSLPVWGHEAFCLPKTIGSKVMARC